MGWTSEKSVTYNICSHFLKSNRKNSRLFPFFSRLHALFSFVGLKSAVIDDGLNIRNKQLLEINIMSDNKLFFCKEKDLNPVSKNGFKK